MKKLHWLKGILFGVSLTAASTVLAEFPDKPIKFLIPYPPGGSADLLARPISEEMSKDLGKPVVLDFKPGAGGTIATSALARSKPDGYTIEMVLAAHAINPNLYKELPYDTEKDFKAVSLVANLPLLVVAPLETKADDITDLVEYAKDNPGEVTFASAGPGNTSHLAGELFAKVTDTEILHIPYKGSGPAVVALLSNEVSMMFDSISTSLPHVKNKKLKALAVTGAERSELLPDVPTVKESGFSDFVINGWYGILAPANTPDDIVEKLNKSFKKAIQTPKVKKLLNNNGYELVGSSPEEFEEHIKEQLTMWKDISKEAGIEAQ